MVVLNTRNPYRSPLECMFVGKDDGESPLGIMLHGFGSHAEDLSGIAETLSVKVPYWIIPYAPVQLFEFLSHRSFAWFPSRKKDIMDALLGKYWDKVEDVDVDELELVADKVLGEIIYPIREDNLERNIIIAGFSQGGMVLSEILLKALSRNVVIHKAIIFSSCLLAKSRWNTQAKRLITEGASKVKLPDMFQSHGTHDIVLPFRKGQILNAFWNQYTTLELFEFNGGHEIPPLVLSEVLRFLGN